jgi:hypothetical protein
MLRQIDNKSVEGDNFKVIVPNVRGVLYHDALGEYVIEIEGGNMGGPGFPDWLVYSQTLSQKSGPLNSTPISPERKREILQRVSECLTLLEMRHEVV